MESKSLKSNNAYQLARLFLDDGLVNSCATIWHIDGVWQVWSGFDYHPVSAVSIENQVLQFLQKGRYTISRSSIKTIVDLVRIIQNIEAKSAPFCLTGSFDAAEVFAVRNGLLSNLTSDVCLRAHDAALFGVRSVDYGFDPSAECPQWERFLLDLWPHGNWERQCLQEWFGYSLLNDTSQQKILSIIGPPRSGKSTIARVLTELLGHRNVSNPSIHDLSKSFGLWGLLGKKLAIIPDAVLTRPCPSLEEVLKSVSGEDAVDVNRKGLVPLTGIRLKCRFLILANERPAFGDPSRALDRRMIELRTQRSFFGAENIYLTENLVKELPGILNWSIAGLKRLTVRGRFPVENDLQQGSCVSYVQQPSCKISTTCGCGKKITVQVSVVA